MWEVRERTPFGEVIALESFKSEDQAQTYLDETRAMPEYRGAEADVWLVEV